jgi:protein SCO1/2
MERLYSACACPQPEPRESFRVGRFRLVFLALALGLATLAGVFALTRPASGPAAASAQAGIGGPFQLVDQDGRPVDQRLLNGKWSAVFFGYTFCPEACPTTLQALAAVQDKLGDKAKDLQIVFISVDPGRDTPAKLKAYLSTHGFPTGVIGLTGTPEQVARAAKAYRVYYARQGNGPDYLMDHSVATYLMDPQGRFAAVLAPSGSPEEAAHQILKEMGSNA